MGEHKALFLLEKLVVAARHHVPDQLDGIVASNLPSAVNGFSIVPTIRRLSTFRSFRHRTDEAK